MNEHSWVMAYSVVMVVGEGVSKASRRVTTVDGSCMKSLNETHSLVMQYEVTYEYRLARRSWSDQW